MQKEILNFINGEYVSTDRWFENRNPINNAVIRLFDYYPMEPYMVRQIGRAHV